MSEAKCRECMGHISRVWWDCDQETGLADAKACSPLPICRWGGTARVAETQAYLVQVEEGFSGLGKTGI